jgi:hypothetical protein
MPEKSGPVPFSSTAPGSWEPFYAVKGAWQQIPISPRFCVRTAPDQGPCHAPTRCRAGPGMRPLLEPGRGPGRGEEGGRSCDRRGAWVRGFLPGRASRRSGPLRPKPTRSVPARRIIECRPIDRIETRMRVRTRPVACWPKHRNSHPTGRSSGSRLMTDPGQPSRLAAVACANARGPDRLQRRPRDGFSPSSLFSPEMPEGTPGAPVEARIATRPGSTCQPHAAHRRRAGHVHRLDREKHCLRPFACHSQSGNE